MSSYNISNIAIALIGNAVSLSQLYSTSNASVICYWKNVIFFIKSNKFLVWLSGCVLVSFSIR